MLNYISARMRRLTRNLIGLIAVKKLHFRLLQASFNVFDNENTTRVNIGIAALKLYCMAT